MRPLVQSRHKQAFEEQRRNPTPCRTWPGNDRRAGAGLRDAWQRQREPTRLSSSSERSSVQMRCAPHSAELEPSFHSFLLANSSARGPRCRSTLCSAVCTISLRARSRQRPGKHGSGENCWTLLALRQNRLRTANRREAGEEEPDGACYREPAWLHRGAGRGDVPDTNSAPRERGWVSLHADERRITNHSVSLKRHWIPQDRPTARAVDTKAGLALQRGQHKVKNKGVAFYGC